MKALGVSMSKMFVALIILMATQARAFDINLNALELQRLDAEYLVDDLSVGVKAIVDEWAFCAKTDELYINRSAKITDQETYYANYEVMLRPDGKVDAILVQAGNVDFNSLPFPSTEPCENEEIQELGFYKVNTIEGVDNLAEFISVALGKGYTIGNAAAAKEIKPIAPVIDTYANVFSNMYSSKIKSSISQCLVANSVSSYGIPDDATLTMGVDFERDGRMKVSSIRLISHSINSDTRAKVLFQGLRRAFLRCNGAGYELPEDSYDNWKSLQITFSKSELFAD